MPTRSSKPHRDANQTAKHILDQLTGDTPKEEPPPVKNAETKRIGVSGGRARAVKLTPEHRSEIALLGASARWKKSP